MLEAGDTCYRPFALSNCDNIQRPHTWLLIILDTPPALVDVEILRRPMQGRECMPNILIVDDDDAIRDTLYDLLSDEYVCQTAETAEKALARLATDSYDVVLTDISMPGLSGLELLGHIRQSFADTPVIIISGIGDQEHAQGLIKLGAFDFLLKPFKLEDVEKSVQRAVEFRRRGLDTSNEGVSESDDWKIVRGGF